MERKRFTELLLQEAYRIEDSDDFINALKANDIGVKIPKFVRELADAGDNESFRDDVDRIIREIKKNGIKPVQGLQALLCIVCPSFSFREVADKIDYRDDLEEDDAVETLLMVLKYWNADWMGSRTEDGGMSIKDSILEARDDDSLDLDTFRDLTDEVSDGVYSHGSNAKGTGNWKDVEMLYPRRVDGWEERIDPYEADGDGWQLFVPQSFDGERAVAWYGTNPKDMKPTNWCTRTKIGYYRNYTRDEDGTETKLYVIRNLKTGHAWQCAIQFADFNFLNEMDKPDSHTEGDLDIFPDRLLELVKDDLMIEYSFIMSARSLADYKEYRNSLEDDPEYEGNGKYIKEPLVLSDRHCRVSPVLGGPVNLNAADYGISKEDMERYRIRVCPILNAVHHSEPNNGSDLSPAEFFSHDFEYGYSFRPEDDGGGEADRPLHRMHNYGLRKGRFWRIIMEEGGETYHQDIGLCNGQHVYGGIAKDSDPGYRSDYNDGMARAFEAIETKMLGSDRSYARFSSVSSAGRNLRKALSDSIRAYYDAHVQELNAFLQTHPSRIGEKEYHPVIRFDQYDSVPFPFTDRSSGYHVRGVDYPVSLPAGIACSDGTVADGTVRFGRINDEGRPFFNMGKQILTDVDTLVAEEYISFTERAVLDGEATRKLYRFMLGIYAATRKVIGPYMLEECAFSEVYSLARIGG